MSASGVDPPPKYKLCPECRHIYPGTSNYCPQDQTALSSSSEIIAGRYILDRMVGAGAMGKVYLAEDTQLGRRVALKLLKPGQDSRRIDLEAKAVGGLDHDNVVRVYERGQHDDGRQYIAMEYLEGESLRTYVATQGPLPLAESLALWDQAVRGVAAAHKKNVIHRDLKPDNLFLARREQDDGTIQQLKVLDFGIAQIRSDRPVRGTVRIGTPGYVAPEQWLHGTATAQSDVYSLGVILLEMLTGRRALAVNPQAPLEQVERLALTQVLSAELRQLLGEVMSPEPSDRPKDAKVLLERLRGLAESKLFGLGAAARETPPTLSRPTSGDSLRPPARSSEVLQPLGADDDDADTEQVGIDSLRPPTPAAGSLQKGLGPATLRVPNLPGLVPTPTPERPTAVRPEKPRGPAAIGPRNPLLEGAPPAIPAPLAVAAPDAATDRPGEQSAAQDAALVTAPVPRLVNDVVTDQVTEPRSDLPISALAEQLTVTPSPGDSTSRLPLLAQSTLVMSSPAEMRTINLPAFPAAELADLKETLGSVPALPKPPGSAPAGPLAATVMSGRSHAATLSPSLTASAPPSGLPSLVQTLPIGSSANFPPLRENRLGRLREFWQAPTVLGSSRGKLMLAGAVLGLLAAVVINLFRFK